MDEAHALKDKNSFRWKNLMSVARNANQRLMLTGTPLQNDLHVCICISECLCCIVAISVVAEKKTNFVSVVE